MSETHESHITSESEWCAVKLYKWPKSTIKVVLWHHRSFKICAYASYTECYSRWTFFSANNDMNVSPFLRWLLKNLKYSIKVGMTVLSYFNILHLALFAEFLWAKSSGFNRDFQFCIMSKDFQISWSVQVGHLNLQCSRRTVLLNYFFLTSVI